MGTHPIFESDFDCLTEYVPPRRTPCSAHCSPFVERASRMAAGSGPWHCLRPPPRVDCRLDLDSMGVRDQRRQVARQRERRGCLGLLQAVLDHLNSTNSTTTLPPPPPMINYC